MSKDDYSFSEKEKGVSSAPPTETLWPHEEVDRKFAKMMGWWPGRLASLFFWCLGLALFGWFLHNISTQYQKSRDLPAASQYYDDAQPLPLPQVTVCNWNQNGSFADPLPTTPLPESEIFMVSCQYQNAGSTDCVDQWRPVKIATSAGVFFCYEFNWDQQNIKYVNSTGYAGSMSTVWKYKQTAVVDPPVNSYGLQVSFTQQGFVTPDVIYNEVQFIPASAQVFYALLLTNTIRYDLSSSDSLFNTTTYIGYNYQFSLSSPTNSTGPAGDGYVFSGVSFGYQDLGRQVNTFTPTYTIDMLFGDFAGMLALLTGLNMIKVAAGLAIGYFSVVVKDITPFFIHYSK